MFSLNVYCMNLQISMYIRLKSMPMTRVLPFAGNGNSLLPSEYYKILQFTSSRSAHILQTNITPSVNNIMFSYSTSHHIWYGTLLFSNNPYSMLSAKKDPTDKKYSLCHLFQKSTLNMFYIHFWKTFDFWKGLNNSGSLIICPYHLSS